MVQCELLVTAPNRNILNYIITVMTTGPLG